DLVVIGARLGRDDHVQSLAIAIGRELKPLDARTDHRTRLDDPVDWILVM
ncbi:hypothetical protein A2U01_0047447, partial [Trifolium medium]|nr:hypothetical protein [Trifolium medium]